MLTYRADLRQGQVLQHTAKQWSKLARELEAAAAEYPNFEAFHASIKLCHSLAMLADLRAARSKRIKEKHEKDIAAVMSDTALTSDPAGGNERLKGSS